MRDIRVLPAVLEDVAEAAAWYDEDGYPGLGDRFIATFYSYLPEIQQNGGIYRQAYLEFHKSSFAHSRIPFSTDFTMKLGLSLL